MSNPNATVLVCPVCKTNVIINSIAPGVNYYATHKDPILRQICLGSDRRVR